MAIPRPLYRRRGGKQSGDRMPYPKPVRCPCIACVQHWRICLRTLNPCADTERGKRTSRRRPIPRVGQDERANKPRIAAAQECGAHTVSDTERTCAGDKRRMSDRVKAEWTAMDDEH